jgi:hypothetical protein
VTEEIKKYLERKWYYLGLKGWQPRCGKTAYVNRNTPLVAKNLRDNPEYLSEANQRLEEKIFQFPR